MLYTPFCIFLCNFGFGLLVMVWDRWEILKEQHVGIYAYSNTPLEMEPVAGWLSSA